jgi:hypothetical protein
VLLLECRHLLLDALLGFRALEGAHDVVAAPAEAGEQDPRRGLEQVVAAATQDRVAALLGQGEVVRRRAKQEEVDHHLLGGGIERRRPQASFIEACSMSITGYCICAKLAQLGSTSHGRTRGRACTPRAGRRLRSGAGCRGTCQVRIVSSATNGAQRLALLEVDGVRRLNLISLFLKYVWRIASPGVNVTSSACGQIEVELVSSRGAEDTAANRCPRAGT